MINCRWLLSLAKKKKKSYLYSFIPFFFMVNQNKKKIQQYLTIQLESIFENLFIYLYFKLIYF
jgi:hypothetical protein